MDQIREKTHKIDYIYLLSSYKLVELVAGGSVIYGAYPVYFQCRRNLQLHDWFKTLSGFARPGCSGKTQISVLANTPTVYSGGICRTRVCNQQGYPV